MITRVLVKRAERFHINRTVNVEVNYYGKKKKKLHDLIISVSFFFFAVISNIIFRKIKTYLADENATIIV